MAKKGDAISRKKQKKQKKLKIIEDDIQLLPVDRENIGEVIALEVAPEQRDYVLDNAVSLAQAYAQSELIPLVIYDGKTPVGFLMYCIDADDGEYWLYRLMVDQKHQGKGFGKRAMTELLQTVQKDPNRSGMFLAVDPASEAAVNLYHALGFRFDGQVFGKEHIMALEWGEAEN